MLILSAALISIMANPFMYRLLPFLERTLKRVPAFWMKLEANIAVPEMIESELVDYVVIIGYGRIGEHLVGVLSSLKIHCWLSKPMWNGSSC